MRALAAWDTYLDNVSELYTALKELLQKSALACTNVALNTQSHHLTAAFKTPFPLWLHICQMADSPETMTPVPDANLLLHISMGGLCDVKPFNLHPHNWPHAPRHMALVPLIHGAHLSCTALLSAEQIHRHPGKNRRASSTC